MPASVQELCDNRVSGTKQHSSNEAEGKVAPLLRIVRYFTEIQKSDSIHSFLEEEVVS